MHTPGATVPDKDNLQEVKNPLFMKFPQSQSISVGSKVTFDCQFYDEVLDVHWFKDGVRIKHEESDSYKISSKNGKVTFEIKSSSQTDVGQYQAKGVGRQGESISAFSLNVH